MKRTLLTICALLISFLSAFAQDADAIKGNWLNAEQDATVEIYKQGEKYYGKIYWTKYEFEADGKTPNRDDKNPDPKLRSQPIVGLIVLKDFTYSNGTWSGGGAYDPKSGKTYKSRMKLKGNNLEIRGYVGTPALGVTTVWTRK